MKKNRKNKVLSFQLTEFQKQYQDVFEKLTENALKKYKSLQGYEKENWLKGKKRAFTSSNFKGIAIET